MIQYLFYPALSSTTQLWITLLIAGLITYGIRLSFILFFSRREIPAWLQRALRFVPPAVLTAIILPELLINSGKVEFSLENGRLIAGIIAIFIAWRTKNALLTILSGMGILWILQWILSW